MTRILPWLVGATLVAGCVPPSLASRLVVTPWRHRLFLSTKLPHERFLFRSGDITLRGWRFPAQGERRGTLFFLHGHSDNRNLAVKAAQRFNRLGYEVFAYDSRAHGESEGRYCTYGVKEKEDLSRAIDASGAQAVVVIGSSLGAAVALQAVPHEPRIQAVVAHAPFVHLRQAVADRAGPLSEQTQAQAIAEAEVLADFRAEEAAPLKVAPKVTVPVLLIHGREDPWTPGWHSEHILEALGSTDKRLLWIEHAGHAEALEREEAWEEIERWLADR